jgi:hypothetical protein
LFIQPFLSLTQEQKTELALIYEELNAELVEFPFSCKACGKCCAFIQFGHQLWLTNIEFAYLFSDLSKDFIKKSYKDCPLMKNKRCTSRDLRSIGCRVFHCNADSETMNDLTEKYLEKIQLFAQKHKIELIYDNILSSLEQLT